MENKIKSALNEIKQHCSRCEVKDCKICTIKTLQNVLVKDFSKFTLIYGIDFDGTIVEENWPAIGSPKQEVISFIRDLEEKGHRWILITMREGEALSDALSFLADFDLFPDAVNDNLPDRIDAWGNNPRKIYADIYIDDHNAGGMVLPDIPEF